MQTVQAYLGVLVLISITDCPLERLHRQSTRRPLLLRHLQPPLDQHLLPTTVVEPQLDHGAYFGRSCNLVRPPHFRQS
jgi:hypothetical protein